MSVTFHRLFAATLAAVWTVAGATACQHPRAKSHTKRSAMMAGYNAGAKVSPKKRARRIQAKKRRIQRRRALRQKRGRAERQRLDRDILRRGRRARYAPALGGR